MSDTPKPTGHQFPDTTALLIHNQSELERELTAAQAEIARLKAGGCSRNQRTTQFCAEAVKLQEENAKLLERVRRLEVVMKNLVMELDAYLRPWNQPSKDPNNKAKRLDLAEDAARFEIKDVK